MRFQLSFESVQTSSILDGIWKTIPQFWCTHTEGSLISKFLGTRILKVDVLVGTCSHRGRSRPSFQARVDVKWKEPMEGFENIENTFVNDAFPDWEPMKLVKAWCDVFGSGYLTNKSSTFVLQLLQAFQIFLSKSIKENITIKKKVKK